MNSSPASSYAFASSSSTRSAEPGRDLAHAIRVDLHAGVLHRGEDGGERQLDLVVEPLGAAFGDALAHRAGEPACGLGARDQRRGLLLRGGLGNHLEPVLALEVLDQVLGAAGLDQVRLDQRVVGRRHRQPWQRLEVVRHELGIAETRDEALVPGADRHSVVLREREAAVHDREAGAAAHLRQLSLPPRNDGSRDRNRHGCGDRVLEVVDPVQQAAELEAAEHLAKLRAVGRIEHDLRGIEVDVEVAPHRRELLRHARLVGELGDVLAPRRRELVRVRDHLLERAVLSDQLARGLVADTRDARDVVRRVALEPDEVRHLVGPDAVAELDPFGRVDVHVRDAAWRHHQRDVRRAELEGVAVGRDHRRLHARLVGARRERRDHVVRLPALELQVAVAERLHDRPEMRELLAQQVGHRPAALLVDHIPRLRNGRPVRRARVPGDCDALGPVVREQLEEHVREPEEGVGREAVARRKLLRQREKGSVREVVAVDEEELGVPSGAVVELQLLSGERLRHRRKLSSRDVTRLEIRPFSDEFVVAAGELLAARHRAHRVAEPLLPARYEEPSAAAAEVESLLGAEGASGVVGLRDGRAVGYLLGAPRTNPIWGEHVWIELAGHAVEDAEDLRDLYGPRRSAGSQTARCASTRWCRRRTRSSSASWSRVGFGQQHAHGIREIPETDWPEGVRLATEDDVDALVELSPLLPDHQALSPVFGGGLPSQPADELRAELLEDLAKPEIARPRGGT